MKKVAFVFVLAVFVPSLALAWLAVRSLRDQQFVLERQQSLLYQGVADSLVQEIGFHLAEQQREFRGQVEELLANREPRAEAENFDAKLRERWPLAEVGFAVTRYGNILCPTCPAPMSGTLACAFYSDYSGFLGNREAAEVYLNVDANAGKFNNGRNAFVAASQNQLLLPQKETMPNNSIEAEGNPFSGKMQSRKVTPAQQAAPSSANDTPSQLSNYSKVVPAEAEFQQLIGDATDGMLARFLQNKLKLVFWHRLERDTNLVFGAQLDLRRVVEGVRNLVKINPRLHEEICVALLDDNAKPVALTHAQFLANWKRPFAASEVGEALPHWEVAVYLLNPSRLTQAAQSVKLTLGLFIAVLVLAISVGSWLIVVDVNRQLRLTRQKTDFVSNVSHELKTPLTSIRMFSELLADGKVTDHEKQRSYLQIISAESARLTRLINNVLDFARMERGEKKYNFQNCDLTELLKDTVETYRPHLESNGFTLDFQPPAGSLSVRGDRDAIAQVVVNLLSNAEKYSADRKEVSVVVRPQTEPVRYVEVQVLDRGLGVPRGTEEKIFEQFYRAHDSLSSGVQGSGLGLTLARQIARAHGGDVVCQPRDGGGSCFTLRLPLQANERSGG